VVAEKAFSNLKEAFSEKARVHSLEALEEVAAAIAEAEHDKVEIRDGLGALLAYDSTYTEISIGEGIRRLRERITDQSREISMLRGLYGRSDDVITSAKVALVDSITADHRWHTEEEKCPHVRCIALNRIERLRNDDI